MGILAAFRFKLLFAWVAVLRRLCAYGTGNRVAARTIHVLHPGLARHKAAFLAGLRAVFADPRQVSAAWHRHRALVGVTRFQGSFYAGDDTDWINNCELDISGAGHVQAAHQAGRGVLVMTYHHHFNMLFCCLLGRLGLPVTTIAMDDRDSARYRKFSNRVDRIYRHAEKLLNGGEIILVKPNSPVRPILRTFERNHLVITANDFPDIFEDKNRRDFEFLGHDLSCPTGTVKLAVKKQIPIVAGYLEWLDDNRFRMTLKPVSTGTDDMKVKTAMANYLAVLEEAVQKDPGLWEGWKWLGRERPAS